ncbi:hypothetical protein CAPTEDRAFT_216943 [Capitella teleta]|uniref:Uncharacterized protein n=1 Tax=Capitella teleta TaxID=283909 RepID=R7T5A8_CAPTE|nr:hypothetical protein CAPTEDRAFT_216943 [Capitella teleta]|eukprot:ELT88156.1 hypothetical protein CAPTEDRAFT_216943 [Capitella teleta]
MSSGAMSPCRKMDSLDFDGLPALPFEELDPKDEVETNSKAVEFADDSDDLGFHDDDDVMSADLDVDSADLRSLPPSPHVIVVAEPEEMSSPYSSLYGLQSSDDELCDDASSGVSSISSSPCKERFYQSMQTEVNERMLSSSDDEEQEQRSQWRRRVRQRLRLRGGGGGGGRRRIKPRCVKVRGDSSITST